jgi:hypothetical protein
MMFLGGVLRKVSNPKTLNRSRLDAWQAYSILRVREESELKSQPPKGVDAT